MTLVDTSVWVDHLRAGNSRLQALLRGEQVLIHPFVVGELACGNLRNRERLLRLLAALPQALQAQHQEVLDLVEKQHLSGLGLGWIDAHLQASALLSKAGIYTLDRQLATTAARLGVGA